jgi:hypothetical protein
MEGPRGGDPQDRSRCLLEALRGTIESMEPLTAPSCETELAAEEVLKRLQGESLGPVERRRLIIEAEVLPFESAQKADLCAILRGFIEQYRNSQDPIDLVAVGSAIRKLVANLPSGDMATVVTLLDAGHHVALPVEVELEVTKSIVRKLTADPAPDAQRLMGLSDCLMDLARAYLRDRILLREKYAAVALNVVLALLLLGGDYQAELVALLRGLRLTWFPELVARRAVRLKKEILRRSSTEAGARVSQTLDEVVEWFSKPHEPSGQIHAGAPSS